MPAHPTPPLHRHPPRHATLILTLALLFGAACSNDSVAPRDTPTSSTLLTGTEGSAGLGDSFYPLLGNGGYDVIHYDIALDVNPGANTVEATTTLTAEATENLAAFNLDFSGMDVDAVVVDGEVAGFSREGSEMTVRPRVVIPTGTQFSVAVTYSGTPQPVADPAVPFVEGLGWQWMDGVIFTVNQPSGAMSWFPGNNHPTDKATFTFRISVPAGSTAAATGVLVEEVVDEGGLTTTWQMNDQMATYLAAVYIGGFDRREEVTPDGLLIRNYLPSDIPPVLTRSLSLTTDVIRYYESILGPYPFEVYGTIVLPFATGFALENQTLPVHGLDSLDPYVIAHEIMHQWIGNSVTVADWSDIWIHEGFAYYLPFMYLAEADGLDLEALMVQEHDIVLSQAASPPKGIEIHEMFDFDAVYRRGGLALHALRLQVGEDAFLDIMKSHYELAAGRNTDTATFLGVVDDLAGEEAAALVESWLFDPEVPPALPTGTPDGR